LFTLLEHGKLDWVHQLLHALLCILYSPHPLAYCSLEVYE
jgi:hypothetical protein